MNHPTEHELEDEEGLNAVYEHSMMQGFRAAIGQFCSHYKLRDKSNNVGGYTATYCFESAVGSEFPFSPRDRFDEPEFGYPFTTSLKGYVEDVVGKPEDFIDLFLNDELEAIRTIVRVVTCRCTLKFLEQNKAQAIGLFGDFN